MNHQSQHQSQRKQTPNHRDTPGDKALGAPQHPMLALQQRYGNQHVLRMMQASAIQREPKTPAKNGQAPADDKPRKGSYSDPIIISTEAKMQEFFEKKNVPEKNRIAEPGDIFFKVEDPTFLDKYGSDWVKKLTIETFLAEFGNSPYVTFYKYDPPTVADELSAWVDLFNLNFDKAEEGAQGSRHGIRGGMGSNGGEWLQWLYIGVGVLGIFSSGKGNKSGGGEEKAGGFWNKLFGKKSAETATAATAKKWLPDLTDEALEAGHKQAIDAFGGLSNVKAIHEFFHGKPGDVSPRTIAETITGLQSGMIKKADLLSAGLDQTSLEIYGQVSEYTLAKIERGIIQIKPAKLAETIKTHETRLEAVTAALKLF
jgi:hypothetical protein